MPLLNKTILLVEDNADDEELALRALRKSGQTSEVAVARDGADALDYLFRRGAYQERAGPQPSLVLLDLKLPKIDGVDVLRAIRADDDTRHVPVVVLTSSRMPDDITRSYDAGANSYVRKPVSFADFLQTVTRLEAYWLLINEVPAARA